MSKILPLIFSGLSQKIDPHSEGNNNFNEGVL